MQVESLVHAAALLYGEPLNSFISARTAMEKEVRAAGDRELAGQIKALRKPSVVAAELNVVARADPAAVEALLEAVADLSEGQQRMAAGEETDFAVLQNCYRSAVDALVELAHGQRQSEVRSSLEAAAVEPSLHQQLRSGTFVEAPQQTGSFGMATLEAVPGSIVRPKQTTKRSASKGSRPSPSVADLRLVRAAKKKLGEAIEGSAAAEAALGEAESALRRAEERAATLEAELAKAEVERRRAEESVEAAKRKAARSAVEVEKAKEAAGRAASS